MIAFIGIDPGQEGGLACLDQHGTVISVTVMPMAGKQVDVCEVARWMKKSAYGSVGTRVAVENVHSMPKQGVASSFKFGDSFGSVRTVGQVLGYSLILVNPPTWKKEVLAGFSHDKDGAARFCSLTWPSVSLFRSERCKKPHDGMADALCIAEYSRHRIMKLVDF